MRPRPYPLHNQRGQNNRRRCAAGNPQGKRRHHGTTNCGIIRRLRPRHTFNAALAEFLLMLGPTARFIIANQRRRCGAQGRQGADEGANAATNPDGAVAFAKFRHARHACRIHGNDLRLLRTAHHLIQHLTNREKPDQYRYKLDTIGQFINAEGKAFRTRGQIHPHSRQQNTKRRGNQILHRAIAANRRAHGKPEYGQRKIFRRPKGIGCTRQQGCGNDQHKNREYAANRRRNCGHAKRQARLALFCHLIAFKRGCAGRRIARRIHHDGSYGTAEIRRAINRPQKTNRRNRAHGDCHWQHQRDGGAA